MNVGIIGAGNIGGTIARKLCAAGHTVKLAAAEGPDHIREQAKTMGAQPVSVDDAVKDVEVVILSVPLAAMPELAGVVRGAAPGAVIIDTSNYYPMRDGQIAEIDGGKPESVWGSEQLGRPLIKTFNAALAHTLAERGAPRGGTGRLAMPVAGDDERGKEIASKLVDDAGFDPVDAGSLASSWRQQPGTPAYCTELSSTELPEALAAAQEGRGPANRDTLMNEFMGASTFPTHDQIIARNREVTAAR